MDFLPSLRLNPSFMVQNVSSSIEGEEDIQWVCVDRGTEDELQKWRVAAFAVGGPLLALSAFGQKRKSVGAFVFLMGAACSYFHFKNWNYVRENLSLADEGAP